MATLLLVVIFIYKCPTRFIFGIPCATCGMTRAFLSAAKLDFKAAFYYHPLFGIIGIELIYLIFRKLILKKIKINIKLEIGNIDLRGYGDIRDDDAYTGLFGAGRNANVIGDVKKWENQLKTLKEYMK